MVTQTNDYEIANVLMEDLKVQDGGTQLYAKHVKGNQQIKKNATTTR